MKNTTYSCDMCGNKGDKHTLIGMGKDSDGDRYFDDIDKTNAHLCVNCINNVFVYIQNNLIQEGDKWRIKKRPNKTA